MATSYVRLFDLLRYVRVSKILEVLEGHPEGLVLSELARVLKDDMSKPTLSMEIERLEWAGVITREKCPRGKVIRLNPEFSGKLKVLQAYIEDFKQKTLHIAREELRGRMAEGSIESGEAIRILDEISEVLCGDVLKALVIKAVIDSYESKTRIAGQQGSASGL